MVVDLFSTLKYFAINLNCVRDYYTPLGKKKNCATCFRLSDKHVVFFQSRATPKPVSPVLCAVPALGTRYMFVLWLVPCSLAIWQISKLSWNYLLNLFSLFTDLPVKITTPVIERAKDAAKALLDNVKELGASKFPCLLGKRAWLILVLHAL